MGMSKVAKLGPLRDLVGAALNLAAG